MKLTADLFTRGMIRYFKWRYPRLQLKIHELEAVSACVLRQRPCRFLVFGLGYDAFLWAKLHKGQSRTVILENQENWIKLLKPKLPSYIEIYPVKYKTKIEEWKDVIAEPAKLEINLPEDILKETWDVILVDGPCGYEKTDGSSEDIPGRMQSIYMASKLIKPGGWVLVHDLQREVERTYCERYLKTENLKARFLNGGPIGESILHCYEIRK